MSAPAPSGGSMSPRRGLSDPRSGSFRNRSDNDSPAPNDGRRMTEAEEVSIFVAVGPICLPSD